MNILQEGLGGIREVIMDKTQNLYLKKYIKATKNWEGLKLKTLS